MITGDMVRIERGRHGMTQRELAEALGVHMRTVTAWEKGERSVPLTQHARLRELLPEIGRADGNPLASVSNLDLITELARRLGDSSR